MLKRLTLSLALFLLSAVPVFGYSMFFSQQVSDYILSPEYIYQKEKFVGLEGKIGLYSIDYKAGAGVKIGVEKSLESSLKGVKLGFEGRTKMTSETDDFFLVFGANFAHYWGKGKKEFRFASEIGIGWPYVSLIYGYGLHISGNKIENIGNHGVTFSVNIPF